MHEYAEEFAGTRRPELIIEQPYLNGRYIDHRALGSAVPDVMTGARQSPSAAFDFKFGDAGIKPSWEARLRSNLPRGSADIPVTEIRPYTPGERITGIGAATVYAK